MAWWSFVVGLALLHITAAQNTTVAVTNPALVYSYTQRGTPPINSTGGLYTACGSSVVSLRVTNDAITLTFKGTQAWVTLWPDDAGSNAQIQLDGTAVANVNTTSGTPWYDACDTLYGWTGIVPYGSHTVTVVKNQDAGIALYVGSFIYDSSATPAIPASTTSAAASSILPTTAGAQSNSVASSSTSATPSNLPDTTGKKSSNAGAIGGGIAAAVIVILLAILGFFLWRRRKTRAQRDHGPVELDGPAYRDHDIEPKPYVQPINPTLTYATTPWQPSNELGSTASPVTAPVLPSSPSVPSSVEASSNSGDVKRPRGPDPTPTQPRTSLSPAELIQSLVERNVPQAELAAAIRMLAASQPAGESSSGATTHLHQDAPPMYDFKEAQRRE